VIVRPPRCDDDRSSPHGMAGMKIVVLDCETTGLGNLAQACEIALVEVDPETGDVTDRFSTLIRPTCAIEVPARAVHHVADVDLVSAPTMARLLIERCPVGDASCQGDLFARVLRNPDHYVLSAHNVDFDRRILVQAGVHPGLLPQRTICTYRCALHMWPDAPAHGNQALRYWLGIDVGAGDIRDAKLDEAIEWASWWVDYGMVDRRAAEIIRAVRDGRLARPTPSPHRALPDALVTAVILDRMIDTLRSIYTVEGAIDELVRLTITPVLLKKVRFGRHYDSLWSDVPRDYLWWILDQDFDEDVQYTARHWLGQL
jgi:exodeoxyribonuclease X